MVDSAASPDFPCQSCEVRDKAICAALADSELRELNRIATAVSVEAGETVFYEGDESTYLFNIVSGSVRLSKSLPDGRRQITGFLFPGDFLGLSIADTYAYCAETLSDSSFCRFDRNKLAGLMQRFPKLEHQLLVLASNELAQAQDHMIVLGQKTAAERLASILLKLVPRVGREDQHGFVIDLPMSREDLADYAGLTTETVSRSFTQLRNDGLIATPDRRSVVVSNREALERITGD